MWSLVLLIQDQQIMWFSQWAVAIQFGRLHVLWPMVETSVLWLMPLLPPTLYLMAM
jgi:hypothetical protein